MKYHPNELVLNMMSIRVMKRVLGNAGLLLPVTSDIIQGKQLSSSASSLRILWLWKTCGRMSSGLNKNCLWNHWIFIFNCGAKYTVCLPLKALRHFDLKWWILEEPRDWVFLDDWEIIQYLGQCPRDGLVKNQFPPWSLPWRNISERVLFLCSDFIEGAMLQ